MFGWAGHTKTWWRAPQFESAGTFCERCHEYGRRNLEITVVGAEASRSRAECSGTERAEWERELVPVQYQRMDTDLAGAEVVRLQTEQELDDYEFDLSHDYEFAVAMQSYL